MNIIKVKARGLYERTIVNPIVVAFMVFIIALCVVGTLSLNFYDISFGRDILVEAHGMLSDILVIGVLIYWLQERGRKILETQRYKDDIDDFRGWESDEAAHRIRGSIIRLSRHKITQLNLRKCCLNSIDLSSLNLSKSNFMVSHLVGTRLIDSKLEEANFSWARLEEADFRWAKLRRANFNRAHLERAIFEYADLEEATFYRAHLNRSNLREASLRKAKFKKAIFTEADLKGVCLRNANLEGSDFTKANFTEADLKGAIFKDADLKDAILYFADFTRCSLIGVKNLTVDQLTKVKTLYCALLGPELEEVIKKEHNYLLRRPEDD